MEENENGRDRVDGGATPGVGEVRTIVVNGREHRFAGDRIGHGELAGLAYPDLAEREGRALVASFGAGPVGRERGVVAHGGKVEVVEGQRFDVCVTDRS